MLSMERLITWRGKKLELSYVNRLPTWGLPNFTLFNLLQYCHSTHTPIRSGQISTSFFVFVTTILIIVALVADFQDIYLSVK